MFNTTPRLVLAAFMLLASGIFIQACAQQAGAAPASGASGTVMGKVTYSDTGAPARMVQVMLLKIYPSHPDTQTAGPTGARPNLLAGLARGLNEVSQQLADTGLDGTFELKLAKPPTRR